MNNYIYYDSDYPERYGPFIEEWRLVKGYERYYSISNYGRLKSHQKYQVKKSGILAFITERILSHNKNSKVDGYINYGICVSAVCKHTQAHLLVAIHFIEKPNGKTQVNHKDGIKSNSFVGNLEWVTASENRYHAYENGLLVPYQSRVVVDISTGIFFDSIKDAAKTKRITSQHLGGMLNGKYKNNTTLIFA